MLVGQASITLTQELDGARSDVFVNVVECNAPEAVETNEVLVAHNKRLAILHKEIGILVHALKILLEANEP